MLSNHKSVQRDAGLTQNRHKKDLASENETVQMNLITQPLKQLSFCYQIHLHSSIFTC